MRAILLGVIALLLCVLQPLQADCRPASPTSLRPAKAQELLVVSQNLWHFHDATHDFRYDKARPAYQVQARIESVADYIIQRLKSPHLLALQEVENKRLLTRLVQAVHKRGGPQYQVHFEPTQDVGGNAVALLSRAPVKVTQVNSLFNGKVIPHHRRAALFSRLPLRVLVTQPIAMQVVVVHLRSGYGLNNSKKRAYVVAKRRGQAIALTKWARQQDGPYLVLGDFNSGPKGKRLFSAPWRRLHKAGWREALRDAPHNYSYVYRCQRQQLDHIYLSPTLHSALTETNYVHGNAGRFRSLNASHGNRPVSDHDAIGAYLQF